MTATASMDFGCVTSTSPIMRKTSNSSVNYQHHCPLAPRRTKQIFDGPAKMSLLDNLEILEAPLLLNSSSSESTRMDSSQSNFDWSFQNSQRSFYSNRKESLKRLRQNNGTLERLIAERQQAVDREASSSSPSPEEYEEQGATTNIIHIDDFMSPPTEASRTIGQTLLAGGQDPSPTGVMDFVSVPQQAMDKDEKKSNADDNGGNNDSSSNQRAVGGLPHLDSL